jgi:hypothetical protein
MKNITSHRYGTEVTSVRPVTPQRCSRRPTGERTTACTALAIPELICWPSGR